MVTCFENVELTSTLMPTSVFLDIRHIIILHVGYWPKNYQWHLSGVMYKCRFSGSFDVK